MLDEIYLDYNATTPIHEEVLEAMMPYLTRHFGSPSSKHAYGSAARAGVDRAREQVAACLGAAPHEIFFTSGGTESNNLAILGSVRVEGPVNGRDALVVSQVEHPASSAPMRYLGERGYEVREVGVSEHGMVRYEELEAALDARCALASIMHANNEVGAVQPIAMIGELAQAVGALLHVDGAQAVGKIPVNVRALGVDLYTVVGHKLYGPKGVGALYVREGVSVRAQVHGAGHEQGLRAGTENVPGIVGLGAACELAGRTLLEEMRRLAGLRDELARRLSAKIPGLRVSATGALRLPQTLHVCIPGVIGHEVLQQVQGVMASTGSACHGPGDPPSATLVAMGIPGELARGALRLSLGKGSTQEQVEVASERLAGVVGRLRQKSGEGME